MEAMDAFVLCSTLPNITLLETGSDCFIPGGVFRLCNGQPAQLEPQWFTSWDKAKHIPAGTSSSLTFITNGDQIIFFF